MADSDVNIVVALALEQLKSGVEQAKSMITDLAAAFGVAFSVDAVKDLVEGMAKLGEQTERTAEILGLSTTTVQELGGVAKVTGTDTQSFFMSLQRLQLGLERGQRVTGQQAEAFKALGVSVKQLLAADPHTQLLIMADAVKKLGDEGKNATPLLMAINRGLGQMEPVLALGAKGIQEWEERFRHSGAVTLPEVDKRLAELNHSIELTKSSLEGLGKYMVSEFASILEKIGDEIVKLIGRFLMLAETGHLAEYFKTMMQGVIDQARLAGSEGMGGVAGGEEVQTQLRKVASDTHAALAKIISAAIAEFDLAVKSAPGARTPASYNANAGQDSKNAMKLAEENYQLQVELADRAVVEMQITESQKVAILKAALQQRMQAEILAGENVQVAERKMAVAVEKLNLEAAKKAEQAWTQFANKFASDFSSAIDKVLTRQATFSQAMGEMFGKMIEQMIAKIVELIAQYIILNSVAAIFDILTGGAGVAFGQTINAGASAGMSGPSIMGSIGKIFGFADGTPYVQGTGLAMLHQGEAVIPASQNPFTGGGAIGGNMNLTIQAMDAASFGSWLRGGGGNMLSRYLMNAWQNNPSMRPGYSQ